MLEPNSTPSGTITAANVLAIGGQNVTAGDFVAPKLPKRIKVPEGQIYVRTESYVYAFGR